MTFIGHLVSWFNVFSHAVAGEVLSCALAENRAELITRFIDTGVVLRSQGNFNGVMEVCLELAYVSQQARVLIPLADPRRAQLATRVAPHKDVGAADSREADSVQRARGSDGLAIQLPQLSPRVCRGRS